MGPFAAVASCYVNILNFSGRARRAEYWWFFVFLMLVGIVAQVAIGVWIARDAATLAALQNPDSMQVWFKQQENLVAYAAYGTAAYIVLAWLPQLTVTIRRLHDTNRSGWYIFMPFAAFVFSVVASLFVGVGLGDGAMPMLLLLLSVPLFASIWFLVVLCLPGTHGPNRFGPDPIKGRKRRAPDHPAFATPADPEERASFEAARRAEIRDYYRKNVLQNGTRA